MEKSYIKKEITILLNYLMVGYGVLVFNVVVQNIITLNLH